MSRPSTFSYRAKGLEFFLLHNGRLAQWTPPARGMV
jgi:hypothetical protein